MLALQVVSMKRFMSRLLAADTFDIFLLQEATVSTSVVTTIDGRLNKEFYSEEEIKEGQVPPYDFMPWNNLKGLCFDLIKGKRTPLSFKFVFQLKPDLAEKLLKQEACSADISQIVALVLTVRYDGTKALLTTGTATRAFLMSKEPDQIWDRALSRYLDQQEIPVENL